MAFKNDFVWGAATASYQVEGAAYEDGKGLNIWDVFTHEKGRIYEDHNGDVACDQYHRYLEDIAIMKSMGIKAYRFSLSWARILPEGTGTVNEKGIAFYNRLIDALLENGIEPYVTLYHWDLPYELHKQGGWLNPGSVEWFGEYAKVAAEAFSDRVKNFFTFNEPQCVVGLGYYTGEHAPGLKVGDKDFFEIWHNVLKAHGRAVQVLRKEAKQEIKVGLASCGAMYYPASCMVEDVEAARNMTFHVQTDAVSECIWNLGMVYDPIFRGAYPEEIIRFHGDKMPRITREDMELIAQPLDYIVQNIYNGVEIRADQKGKPVRVKRYEGFPKTAIQWPVTPECMYWGPKYLWERYGKPVIISENGMSSHDWISVDGQVHDPARIDFMTTYLDQLEKAADEGVELAAYFAWSLLDNFEWASGYSDRFGLVYVDYPTQKRILKDSAYFYRDYIKAFEAGKNL